VLRRRADDRGAQLANLERRGWGVHKADHELLLRRRACGEPRARPLRRHEQLDGVLVFSSVDPLRFTQELASDFWRTWAGAAICIENASIARAAAQRLHRFLTGFHNRRYLQAPARRAARAQRARQSIVCLMIDVDHFKRINDQYDICRDAVLREWRSASRRDAYQHTGRASRR